MIAAELICCYASSEIDEQPDWLANPNPASPFQWLRPVDYLLKTIAQSRVDLRSTSDDLMSQFFVFHMSLPGFLGLQDLWISNVHNPAIPKS